MKSSPSLGDRPGQTYTGADPADDGSSSAWDRQCAFCGFDGLLGTSPVGIEAAHVRWFNFDGPDHPDNGLALCSRHHRLFDRGALGLAVDHFVKVSAAYAARTAAGRAIYELHGRRLEARPGTTLPAAEHVAWHDREVFKSVALAARQPMARAS